VGSATTKGELLAALRAERARWQTLLDDVGEDRLAIPGVVDDWSVRDLLGHLAAYLRYWGAQLRGVVTGVPPTPRDLFDTESVPAGLGTVSLDEQNAMIRARYRTLALPVVPAKWRRAFDLITDGVAALSEEDLTALGRFVWAGGASVADAMAVPIRQHLRTHAEDVRAWLDRIEA
jgi:hypothetical protein